MARTSLQEARREVADLARKGLALIDDDRLDDRRKTAALNKLDQELKAATHQVRSLESVEERKNAIAAAHGVHPNHWGGETFPPVYDVPGFKMVGAAPPLVPSEGQLRELHEAVVSHKSARIEVAETKSVSGDVPSMLMPSIVGLDHEPTRILDLIPSTGMSAPSVEYIRHVSTTGTAGMVAPGALKPAVTLNTDKLEARAKKIAVTTKANDEDLEDFGAFLSYIGTELQRLVIDQENEQLLTGDGTGENLQGIFSVTGILTRIKGASPETGIDTLELAATDLRTGPAKVAATLYAMHPNTWSGLRLLKDSQGRYILGNPAEQDASKLWGVPVVQSTGIAAGIAAGTVLAMNPQAAAQAFIRKGLVIQTDYGHRRV